MTCTVRCPARESRDKTLETGREKGWSASYGRLDASLSRMA